MLKKLNRLRLRREREFFSQAIRVKGSGYSVFIRQKMHPRPQVAFIVSKKSVAASNQRSLLKRKARSYCRDLIRDKKLAPIEYALFLENKFFIYNKQSILRELQELANKVYFSAGK